jgi:hypothetical protein
MCVFRENNIYREGRSQFPDNVWNLSGNYGLNDCYHPSNEL